VKGMVDEIELRKLSKESYFLVEINTVDGREAVIQVNEITGIIMSVIRDDKRADDRDEDESKIENAEDVNFILSSNSKLIIPPLSLMRIILKMCPSL
jgi:hypothetical protein